MQDESWGSGGAGRRGRGEKECRTVYAEAHGDRKSYRAARGTEGGVEKSGRTCAPDCWPGARTEAWARKEEDLNELSARARADDMMSEGEGAGSWRNADI